MEETLPNSEQKDLGFICPLSRVTSTVPLWSRLSESSTSTCGAASVAAVWATFPARTAMDPQGPQWIVSTLLLLLHRVTCQLPPNSFPLHHLNLLLQPQFHHHLQSQSSPPVGRNHSRVPLRPLPFPLLIGGLIHQSSQTALQLVQELAQCTASQEILWQ